MSTIAYVTPEILQWARLRAGASIEQAAGKINTKPERLLAWEEGKERPSIRQAQHLAGALHIPFGYLFLSQPPDEDIPITDFRTHRSKPLRNPSPELLDVLYDVLLKQEWYHEFLEQEGRPKVPFVGSFGLNSAPKTIAANITETLGIDKEKRPDDFLREIIHLAELRGVIVMRSGIVGSNSHRHLRTEEFRGFAVCDDLAPIIFINSTDSKAAQSFTVVHELAHIWLGASGISNETLQGIATDANDVEKLCNQVAAETLVPGNEFEGLWSNRTIEANLIALGRHFRVSSLVLLRRAFDLGAINKNAYFNHYESEVKKYKQREEAAAEESSGGNFFNTFFARNSAPLVAAVIGSVGEGRTTFREAARLLNVKVPTISKIAEQVAQKGNS